MFLNRKINKFYLLGIKTLLFLIPCIPLYVSTSMPFPFITGKNFAFRIIVELAAALWLGLIVINKEYRPRNSLLAFSILIFTFIVGLADLFGVNPYKSFWSDYERMEGYITILHLTVYFFLLQSMLRTKKEWAFLGGEALLVSCIVGMGMFVYSLNNNTASVARYVMEYGTRAHSTIGNPPFLASYLLLLTFIGIILFLNTQKKYLKLFCILVVVFNYVVIYLTGSRGAILSGAVGMILGLIFISNKKNVFQRRYVPRLIVSIFIVLSILFGVVHYVDVIKQDRTISRFSVMFSDFSSKTRLSAWKMALNGVKERPLLGWGQENFAGIYTVNKIPLADNTVWLDRAHNIVVDWLVNAGVLGLISYLMIFASALYTSAVALKKYKVKRSEVQVIVIAMVVYFIQNLFIFDTINTYMIFFAILAYIDNLRPMNEPVCSEQELAAPSKNTNVKLFSLILILVSTCAAMIYYLNYRPVKQARKSLRISMSIAEYDSAGALLNDFNSALQINTFGNSDVRQRMMAVANSLVKSDLIYDEGSLEFIQAGVKEAGNEIASYGYDLEYLRRIIQFFYTVAQKEESFVAVTDRLIKECIRINPQYHWLYSVLADVDILKKDYESAFENISKIVALDPQNDKKLLKFAIAAIYLNREALVKSTLEKIENIRVDKNKNIASGRETVFSAKDLYQIGIAYMNSAKFHKALEYFNETVKVLLYDDKLHIERDYMMRRPIKRARLHMEMAYAYLSVNDRKRALKEAEKAEALDPLRFKGKSEQLLIN